jgi:acetylglutamate kinase
MNPLIIKLGGVLLDSEEALERLFTALVNYRESHQRPLVIVHGGGCVVDELMKQLNLPVKKKNGLRVTPADQIDIITGALAERRIKPCWPGRKSITSRLWVCILAMATA